MFVLICLLVLFFVLYFFLLCVLVVTRVVYFYIIVDNSNKKIKIK